MYQVHSFRTKITVFHKSAIQSDGQLSNINSILAASFNNIIFYALSSIPHRMKKHIYLINLDYFVFWHHVEITNHVLSMFALPDM